jgi:nucleotide-binding universal stress UspA family protein
MSTQPKIGRIVIAHDFSDTAEYALTYGLGVAEKFGARVTIVHVTDVGAYGYPDAFVASLDWAAEAERVAADALEGIAAKSGRPNVVVDTALRRGSPWSGITSLASELDADLIVMGTHGRRGISHALLGSVAEKVVRVARCPVLTVHLPQAAQLRAEETKAESRTHS